MCHPRVVVPPSMLQGAKVRQPTRFHDWSLHVVLFWFLFLPLICKQAPLIAGVWRQCVMPCPFENVCVFVWFCGTEPGVHSESRTLRIHPSPGGKWGGKKLLSMCEILMTCWFEKHTQSLPRFLIMRICQNLTPFFKGFVLNSVCFMPPSLTDSWADLTNFTTWVLIRLNLGLLCFLRRRKTKIPASGWGQIERPATARPLLVVGLFLCKASSCQPRFGSRRFGCFHIVFVKLAAQTRQNRAKIYESTSCQEDTSYSFNICNTAVTPSLPNWFCCCLYPDNRIHVLHQSRIIIVSILNQRNWNQTFLFRMFATLRQAFAMLDGDAATAATPATADQGKSGFAHFLGNIQLMLFWDVLKCCFALSSFSFIYLHLVICLRNVRRKIRVSA